MTPALANRAAVAPSAAVSPAASATSVGAAGATGLAAPVDTAVREDTASPPASSSAAAGPAGAPHDRGGATIMLLAIGLVLLFVGVGGAMVGSARVARHQARVAADFGALAGAPYTVDGADAACRRAGEIVEANRARLITCRIDGLDLLVAVEVTVRPLPGLDRRATSTARAGPIRHLAGAPGSSPD